MQKYLFGLIACIGMVALAAANALPPPPFPRLGAFITGSPQNYDDPKYQAAIARTNVVVFSYWPGWEHGRAVTFEEMLKNLKRANPAIQTFIYAQDDEIGQGVSSSGYLLPVWNKIKSMNWLLYRKGTEGDAVPSFWQGGGGPFLQINNTLFAPKDSDGLRWLDWYAKWAVSSFVKPNPSLDGFFTDNVFWKPRADGDWNRDGVTDLRTDPTVQQWYRAGYEAFFADLRTLMPGKYQIGNVETLGDAGAVFPEFNQILNGGFMEGQIGYSWSVETWGGWNAMMSSYRQIMRALAAPKLGMFAQIGSSTDYQSMRYGLTSCLMDDGYFTFSSSAKYNDLPWFDEFNVKLGEALAGPSIAPWKKGVYRRDFQNGIALVNPKGNGVQTVTLEAAFVKISGSQAPDVNNGESVTAVMLQDRDGIILLRSPSSSHVNLPAASK
jgi:hypothetical protein